MKTISRIFLLLTAMLIFFSCAKEYSLESGGVPPIVDTANSNCKIEKIIVSDYFSRVVEFGFNSTYAADHTVSNIEIYDSINHRAENSFAISHPAGKVQVDASQYFITGTDGKVTEFHGFEYPEDPTSDKVTVKYTYNATGQLTKRTEEYDLLPGVTTYEMTYTYAGNNLSRTEARANNGSSLQKFIDVAYEYETTKTIRNFIYFNAVAPEIFYFQTAINAGLTSANPVKKATTTFVKLNNGQDSTTVANFVNYAYDAKGHVLAFEVTGGDFAANNIYAGKKYVFKYLCF